MKRIAIGVIAALCVGAGTAAAQGFGPVYNAPMMTGHPMYQQGPMWGSGIMFDQQRMGMGMAGTIVDQNGDGVVSAEEAAAWHEANFDRMDEDGDGKVNKGEFLAGGGMGRGQGRGAQYFTQREARFAEIDSDKDGAITLEEYLADAKNRFAASDGDGDGKVSVWEYRGRRRM
jgi:Ca2+-binding EF-hand superfamily protein